MSCWTHFKRWINANFRGREKKEQWAWAWFDWAKSPYENAVLGVFLGPFITGLAKRHSCELYPSLYCIYLLFSFTYNTISTCLWCVSEGVCQNTIAQCADCKKDSDWCCDQTGYVGIGSSSIAYGSVYAYSISASAIIQVILLPFVGAFADATKSPKLFLFISTLASCVILVLFLTVTTPSLFWLAALFSILGNVLYALTNVFYNALLINVASPKEHDFVSSLGYAVGYVGGGVLLVVGLLYYLAAPTYTTIRIVMAICGVWWLLFSIVTFKGVTSTEPRHDTEEAYAPPGSNDPNCPTPPRRISVSTAPSDASSSSEPDSIASSTAGLQPEINITDSIPSISNIVVMSATDQKEGVIKGALMQLWRTFMLLRRIPYTGLFLIASAIFNDGISTVSSLAGTYASEALNASFATIAILALIANFSGILGAFVFNWLAKKITTKYSILISLLLWCAVVIYAYLIKVVAQLYIIGFLIGVGLGSSQPLSRSLMANLIPKGFENQIFSFYELTQRGTSWIGPLVYASVTAAYDNNPRPGIIILMVFFVVGGILLFFVNVDKAVQMAKKIDEDPKK